MTDTLTVGGTDTEIVQLPDVNASVVCEWSHKIYRTAFADGKALFRAGEVNSESQCDVVATWLCTGCHGVRFPICTSGKEEVERLSTEPNWTCPNCKTKDCITFTAL